MKGSWMLLATMQTCDFVPSEARKWAARSEAILIRLLGNKQVSPSQEMRQRHRTMAGKWKGGLDNSIHTVIIKIGNYQPWLFEVKLTGSKAGHQNAKRFLLFACSPRPPGRLLRPLLTAGTQRGDPKASLHMGPCSSVA